MAAGRPDLNDVGEGKRTKRGDLRRQGSVRSVMGPVDAPMTGTTVDFTVISDCDI